MTQFRSTPDSGIELENLFLGTWILARYNTLVFQLLDYICSLQQRIQDDGFKETCKQSFGSSMVPIPFFSLLLQKSIVPLLVALPIVHFRFHWPKALPFAGRPGPRSQKASGRLRWLLARLLFSPASLFLQSRPP